MLCARFTRKCLQRHWSIVDPNIFRIQHYNIQSVDNLKVIAANWLFLDCMIFVHTYTNAQRSPQRTMFSPESRGRNWETSLEKSSCLKPCPPQILNMPRLYCTRFLKQRSKNEGHVGFAKLRSLHGYPDCQGSFYVMRPKTTHNFGNQAATVLP